MNLFKSTRAYVLAFLCYVVAALLTLSRLEAAAKAPLPQSALLLTPKVAGTTLCIVLLLRLLNKTISALERAALLLSAAFFGLYLCDVLREIGWSSLVIPSERALSAFIASAAAIIAGWRLSQMRHIAAI